MFAACDFSHKGTKNTKKLFELFYANQALNFSRFFSLVRGVILVEKMFFIRSKFR